MKKARCRRSIGPSRCCRSHPARPSGAVMITSAMARRRCSPPSILPPAGCSAAATGATAQPSSAASSMPSTLLCRPISISIWSWTITLPTRRRRSKLGLPKWPRYHLHFTPTYASWLNQVERWFALLTERQIHRGVHRSIKELEAAVAAFIADHNAAPRPFLWTKSADQIFNSIARFCKTTLTVHANS